MGRFSMLGAFGAVPPLGPRIYGNTYNGPWPAWKNHKARAYFPSQTNISNVLGWRLEACYAPVAVSVYSPADFAHRVSEFLEQIGLSEPRWLDVLWKAGALLCAPDVRHATTARGTPGYYWVDLGDRTTLVYDEARDWFDLSDPPALPSLIIARLTEEKKPDVTLLKTSVREWLDEGKPKKEKAEAKPVDRRCPSCGTRVRLVGRDCYGCGKRLP